MSEVVETAAVFCGYLMGIFGLVMYIVKPLKSVLKKMGDVIEANKCSLRADMLSTYYKHKDEHKIRQYEKENFLLSYSAYKALGGNSFIDDVARDVRIWEVET